MKSKKIIFSVIAVLIIVTMLLNVNLSVKNNNLSDISLDSVEADADCEITNSQGNVILRCSGAETCSIPAGNQNITCSGTRIN